MKKRTDWYSGDVSPIRKGIYERERNSTIIYSYWDGSFWCVGAKTVKLAYMLRACIANHQHTPWRGLCQQF